MSISSEFIKIVEKITSRIFIPQIKNIVIPKQKENVKKSNFAALILEDNSIGIFFINLRTEVKLLFKNFDSEAYKGMNPSFFAKKFESKDLFDKSLGLGAINAIGQFIFKKCNFSFEYISDSLGLLEIEKHDTVGMVGFFPSLVNIIESKGNKLIVIEKKKELLKKGKNWKVTLDPSELELCNKILITSTTVLNETIDEILQHCSNAEKVSMIGPTAGFLPDPLFKRGIDIIGGSQIIDSRLLIHSIRNNIRWGKSVKKYIIKRADYIGYENILKQLN